MESSWNGKNCGAERMQKFRRSFISVVLGLTCGVFTAGCVDPTDMIGNGSGTEGEKVVKSLSVSGPETVEEGTVAQFTVTATYDDGSKEDVTGNVTWQVSDNLGSFKSTGEYTAPEVVLEDVPVRATASYPGTEAVNATAKAQVVEATASFTLIRIVNPLTSVTITGPNGACEGGAVPLKCMATYRSGAQKDVTASARWTISTGPGTISTGGVYTAPESVTQDTPVTVHVAYSEGIRLRQADKTMSVTGIRVSPDSLSWDGSDNGEKTIKIDGVGATVVNYTIGDIPEWLKVTPATGNAGGQVTVAISDRTKLPSGTNTAMLKVTPSIGGVSGAAKTVTITVLATVISLSVTDMDFSTDKTSQTFEIWNSGNGTLTYTLSSDAQWLTLVPASGQSTAERTTVTATVNRTGLAPGNYTAKITATAPGSASRTVTATMGVSETTPPPTSTEDVGIGDFTAEILTAGMKSPFTTKPPTLDGQLATGEWSDARTYTMDAVDTTPPGVRASGSSKTTADTSARIYVKHDADYVYVAVKVTDNNVIGTAANVWEADSVELFLDADNSRTPGIGMGRIQLDISADGTTLATPPVPAGSWNGAAAKRTDGYVVEYKLSKSALQLGAGGVCGIDVNINDIEPAAGTLSANYWLFATGTDPEMDESQWGTLTLLAGPGALSVTPATGLTSTGAQGGAFAPANVAYTVTNTGGTSVNWTASTTQPWVTLSKTSGTLAAGATDTVTVSIGTGANTLVVGSYTDTVTFTNATNGSGNVTRPVSLAVTAAAPANKAPTANAGADQTVTDSDNSGSESITLDGSGSADSDGTIANYQWTEGSTILYTGTNSKSPVNLAVGSHTITLTVKDDKGATATDTVVITVNRPAATTGSPMTTANRTSGMAPLAVFFDAVNMSSPAWTSGVVQPSNGDHSTFDYRWDFGDTNSGTWSTNGKSKNTATGCVAAHVYDNAGTYRVTLTVTDAAGQTRVYTQDITVTAFNGTTYYVSSTGNDSNNGTSTSTPWRTFDRAIQAATANTQILFKRGETFSTGGKTVNAAGPGIIGAYASGNKPIVQVTGTGGGLGFFASDWRLMDIDFMGPGRSADQNGGVYLNASRGTNNILIYRITSREFRTGITWSDYSSMYSTPHDGNAIVDSLVANAGTNGTFVGGRRLAILGTTIQNIDTSHVLRVWQGHKCVLSHNVLHNPGPTRHALKLHSPTVGDGRPETRYVEISDNDFRGKTWAISIGPQDNLENEHVSHVVFERNRTRSEQSIDFDMKINSQDVTIRNNVFDGTGSSSWYQAVGVERRGVEPAPTNIRIYNNTVYKSDSASNFWICNVSSSASNVTVKNNLGYAPNVSTTGVVTGSCSGLVVTNNLVTNTPGFVNASTVDVRLTSGSPAIDAGTPLNWVRADYSWTGRPQGSQYDLGAYEYKP